MSALEAAAAITVLLTAAPNPPLPPRAVEHIPTLKAEVAAYWPDAPHPSAFAGQVEQETCYSLTHRKCWSPYAELKTDREYGFGLGQLTVTQKFDNFKEAQKLHPSLKEWTWENRYNATYQLRTMVLMDKFNYGKATWAENSHERMAFSFAAYNGGLGGVMSDRTVCKVTDGCNPNVWFGGVEHTSKKAKKPVSGYGKSFFEINREYVRNILYTRREKYRPVFGD